MSLRFKLVGLLRLIRFRGGCVFSIVYRVGCLTHRVCLACRVYSRCCVHSELYWTVRVCYSVCRADCVVGCACVVVFLCRVCCWLCDVCALLSVSCVVVVCVVLGFVYGV